LRSPERVKSKMFIKVLKQLKQIKKDYPNEIEFVFYPMRRCIITNNGTRYFDKFVINKKHNYITYFEYGNGLPFYRYIQNIMDFFITHGIYDIQYNYKTTRLVFGVKHYSPEQLAAIKIWKYYRKYRYNIFRKRLDPLKKELMEYCWNPSRMSFEV
jgi:hypothetical protein